MSPTKAPVMMRSRDNFHFSPEFYDLVFIEHDEEPLWSAVGVAPGF